MLTLFYKIFCCWKLFPGKNLFCSIRLQFQVPRNCYQLRSLNLENLFYLCQNKCCGSKLVSPTNNYKEKDQNRTQHHKKFKIIGKQFSKAYFRGFNLIENSDFIVASYLNSKDGRAGTHILYRSGGTRNTKHFRNARPSLLNMNWIRVLHNFILYIWIHSTGVPPLLAFTTR